MKVTLNVFRDSHGHWWIDEREIKKLCPELKIDSCTKITVDVLGEKTQ